jgi:hypothetical protein
VGRFGRVSRTLVTSLTASYFVLDELAEELFPAREQLILYLQEILRRVYLLNYNYLPGCISPYYSYRSLNPPCRSPVMASVASSTEEAESGQPRSTQSSDLTEDTSDTLSEYNDRVRFNGDGLNTGVRVLGSRSRKLLILLQQKLTSRWSNRRWPARHPYQRAQAKHRRTAQSAAGLPCANRM